MDRQRLLAAGGVFIGGVFAYGALTLTLGEQWQVLMGILMFPYAAVLGTFIHFRFLK